MKYSFKSEYFPALIFKSIRAFINLILKILFKKESCYMYNVYTDIKTNIMRDYGFISKLNHESSITL